MKLRVLLFSLACVFPVTRALVKTWWPSTSAEDTISWTPHRSSPCRVDTLVFPREAVATLSTSLPFSLLVLPLSGEILLNEGAVLESVVNEASCQGKEYQFHAGSKHSWWKPSSWNTEWVDLLVGDPQNVPVVLPSLLIASSDRVPCSFDDVVIPNGTDFRMILEGDVRVRSLTVNGQKMDGESFASFARSAEGRRLVEGEFTLRVNGDQEDSCTDPTGCLCNNAMDQENFMRICEVAGACPFTKCKDPIMPDGYCCPFCCSLVDFEYSDGFQMSLLRSKLKDILSQFPVSCFMSKRSEGKIQAVCVDNDDQGNVQTRRFVERATSSVLQDAALRVTSVRSLHSVEWPSDQNQSSELDVGLTVGLLFFFLLLAVGIGSGYYFYRRKRLPELKFVRFDRLGRAKVEVELGTTPHDELQPQDEPSTARGVFYNPVYGKEQSSSSVERMPDHRENPLYGLDDDVVEAEAS